MYKAVMLSIGKALLLDRRMRALTSLDGPAFVQLEKRFARVLAEELSERTRAGHPRQRAAGAGPKGELPGVRSKPFFILFYLKACPPQDVMGYFFNRSQSQVSQRAAQLLPLLPTLMAAELPARHGRDLPTLLAALPEVREIIIGGTERPIARPQHKTRRAHHCSGRRKRATIKNVVASAGGRVVLVTPTAPGRRHDKAEADRARACAWAKTGGCWATVDFQGCQAGAPEASTPHKKPRGGPPHWQHRRSSRKLARARVPVEHVLASVKRLGILRQPLRAKRRTMADQVMVLGCALHNYRQEQRALAV